MMPAGSTLARLRSLGRARAITTVCAGVLAPAFIYRQRRRWGWSVMSCFLSPGLPRRSAVGAVAAASTMSDASATTAMTFLDSNNKEARRKPLQSGATQ
eukprot:Skav218024  [mRNA]  locus=scaffold214:7665:9274:- [translate_table: standard]